MGYRHGRSSEAIQRRLSSTHYHTAYSLFVAWGDPTFFGGEGGAMLLTRPLKKPRHLPSPLPQAAQLLWTRRLMIFRQCPLR